MLILKKVIEVKNGKESLFLVETSIGNTILSEKTVVIKSAIVEKDNKQYFLLYDSKMQVISSVYRFLNHGIKKSSFNTKRHSLYALKYLYAFSEIIDVSIENFTFENFIQLTYFLKGCSAEGDKIDYEILTKRGNESINMYFSTYREFYKFVGLSTSPLFRERTMAGYIPGSKYELSTLTKHKSFDDVPKYISTDDFKSSIKYIRSNIKDKERALRAECIVRIMYEGGLRLGEVLGSTLEDYVIKEVNDEDLCFVYIRNRLTDKQFQCAKTCMKVFNKRNYSNNDYKTRNVGYQLSFLNMDTYDLLCEYIDLAHERAFKNQKTNYAKAKADAVDLFKTNKTENYYVFLNSKGTPLSNVSWSQELRDVFVGVGLAVDSHSKNDNLSHRFRHGFVMHLIHDLKLPREKVMARSRHRSYSGLDAYYNPTTSDLVNMKQEIEDIILSEEDYE